MKIYLSVVELEHLRTVVKSLLWGALGEKVYAVDWEAKIMNN